MYDEGQPKVGTCCGLRKHATVTTNFKQRNMPKGEENCIGPTGIRSRPYTNLYFMRFEVLIAVLLEIPVF
jgi:hypothetical protein